MSMERFMIREKAQKPIRVPLIDPATGKETEDWLEIRSSLSDEFLTAREDVTQKVQSINEPDRGRRMALVRELQLELKVALVAGWSFDVPCDKVNVTSFLREAPQVQNMINAVADDAASFFGGASEDSSSGRKKK